MPWVVELLGAALALTSPPGDAATLPPSPLQLTVRAPAGCPDEAALAAAIDPAPSRGEAASVEATIAIREEPTGQWTAELTLERDGVASARVFSATSCEEAAQTAAWLIALAITESEPAPASGDTTPRIPTPPEANPPRSGPRGDEATRASTRTPGEQAQSSERAPAGPAQSSERAPAGPRSDRSAPARTPSPTDRSPTAGRPDTGPRRVSLLVAPAVGLAVGPAPGGAVPLLDLGVAVARGAGRFALAGSYAFARRVQDPGDSDVIGYFDVFTGAARGCGAPRLRAVTFPLCGGLIVGGMRGRGQGPIVPLSAVSIWFAATASAGVEWWVYPRVALTLVGRGAVSLTIPRFHVDPSQREILRAMPAAFWGLVGVTIRAF